MDTVLDWVQSLTYENLHDIRLLLFALASLALIFGIYLFFTKSGKDSVRSCSPALGCLLPFVCLVIILLPVGWEGMLNWLSTPTDPQVVGRQPDMKAPLNTSVNIDNFSVRVDQPAKITSCKFGEVIELHSDESVASGAKCDIELYAHIACELDPSQYCAGPLYYHVYHTSGERANVQGAILRDIDVLPGGQELVLDQRREVFITVDSRELYLEIQGPGGYTLSKHKAYLALMP